MTRELPSDFRSAMQNAEQRLNPVSSATSPQRRKANEGQSKPAEIEAPQFDEEEDAINVSHPEYSRPETPHSWFDSRFPWSFILFLVTGSGISKAPSLAPIYFLVVAIVVLMISAKGLRDAARLGNGWMLSLAFQSAVAYAASLPLVLMLNGNFFEFLLK